MSVRISFDLLHWLSFIAAIISLAAITSLAFFHNIDALSFVTGVFFGIALSVFNIVNAIALRGGKP